MNDYYVYFNSNQYNKKIIECIIFDLKNGRIYDIGSVYEFSKANDLIGDNYTDREEHSDLFEEYLTSYPENKVIPISLIQLRFLLCLHKNQVFNKDINNFLKNLQLEEWLI